MFRKFTSIENAYRQKEVDGCYSLGADEVWVAREKLHGANFSFIAHLSKELQVIQCQVASRNEVLGTAELVSGFYGCRVVVDRYMEEFINLVGSLRATGLIEWGDTVQLYGELYGTGIQREIQYFQEPYKDFAAFALTTNGAYVSNALLEEILSKTKIPLAMCVVTGTLEQVLAYDVEGESPTAKANGVTGTVTEGIVISPWFIQDARLSNGKVAVLKKKSTAFQEKKTIKTKAPSVLDDELKPVVEDFSLYLSEARLSNVMSKIGDVSLPKEFGKVTGLFVQDALEDFEKDQGAIDKEVWSKIKKYIQQQATTIVRAELIQK